MVIGNFLPMLMIDRGASFAGSAYYLSAALLAGMFGLFIGGHLSDLYGRRKIMAITMLISSPLLYGFLHTTGVIFSCSGFVRYIGAFIDYSGQYHPCAAGDPQTSRNGFLACYGRVVHDGRASGTAIWCACRPVSEFQLP